MPLFPIFLLQLRPVIAEMDILALPPAALPLTLKIYYISYIPKLLALSLTLKIYYISYFSKTLGLASYFENISYLIFPKILASCCQLNHTVALETSTQHHHIAPFCFPFNIFSFWDFCWKSSRLLSTNMRKNSNVRKNANDQNSS